MLLYHIPAQLFSKLKILISSNNFRIVLGLAGMDIIFCIGAHMLLCFRSVTKQLAVGLMIVIDPFQLKYSSLV